MRTREPRGCFSSARPTSRSAPNSIERRSSAAAAVGVRHVVYTSGLNPEPPNPAVIGPSHYATERALVESGLSWTVLRDSLYSEYQVPEAAQAIASGRLTHNRGNGEVAYVSRDDCAAVAAAVVAGPGHDDRCLRRHRTGVVRPARPRVALRRVGRAGPSTSRSSTIRRSSSISRAMRRRMTMRATARDSWRPSVGRSGRVTWRAAPASSSRWRGVPRGRCALCSKRPARSRSSAVSRRGRQRPQPVRRWVVAHLEVPGLAELLAPAVLGEAEEEDADHRHLRRRCSAFAPRTPRRRGGCRERRSADPSARSGCSCVDVTFAQ